MKKLIPLLGILFLSIPAHAQPRPPSFEVFEPGAGDPYAYKFPSGVSRDGSVVVGFDENGLTAFRWVRGVGGVSLPSLPGFAGVNATAVSADGTVAVGWCGPRESGHALRWVGDQVEDMGLAPGDLPTRAYAVSADGRVVVGVAGVPPAQRAFRWTPQVGYQLLPLPAGQVRARATAISGDASTIFGD